MPGDPATAIAARLRGELSPEALEALRAAFGVEDRSLLLQYADYLALAARGELGVSVSHFPARVTEVIGSGLAWTVFLSGAAVVISFGIGTLLGVVTAFRRSGWLDTLLPPTLLLIGSFPYFWLAMFALLIFGFELQWFPVRHAYDDRLSPELTLPFIASAIEHALLPATVIVAATLGGWLLRMRNSMISVLSEDYVLLAQAKGLAPTRVMLSYAARNALLPNLTSFGMALGFVLSGSLLTEIVFAYPGLGYLLLEAVQNQDYPLLQGLFLCITTAVLVSNALVDLVYVMLDPRTRANRR